MKEEWKDIKGYGGTYRVSNRGRVLSMKRPRTKILSPLNHNGYQKVRLRNGAKYRGFYIHRLVLLHFVPNPESKPETNHKNGIKSDNRLENLEWSTPLENIRHAYDTGLRRSDGEYHQGAKLNNFQVRVIRKSDLKQTELASIFNVTPGNISAIKTRRSWI